jgi:hypothetical protein
MVIFKTPQNTIVTVGGIPATGWFLDDETGMYVFTSDQNPRTAEFRADTVLAIAIDDSPEPTAGPDAKAPQYLAADLVGAMIEWYYEEYGSPHDDVLAATQVAGAIIHAISVTYSYDRDVARDFLQAQLALLVQRSN